MLAIIRQLVTPLDYLRVRSTGAEKALLDIYLPATLTVASLVVTVGFPSVVPFLGDHGFVANLNGLLQTLTGFYVGALAAVATFPNPLMDRKTDNLYLDRELIVRRLFVAKLFAFLAMGAFALYLAGLFINIPSHVYHEAAPTGWKPYLRASGIALYLFVFWQMLCVTLLGLYYLCERIHRSPS